ncbi:SprB repeat-containing protein, partial [Christiangramia sp.]|uniref:SprB repeat-containing protein n=1 Tax=Christiangramia sp. TaxID=1931228 RepID=UPI002617124B
MYKTTFGPRIHYVITLSLIFFTLSLWTGGNLFAQISITTDSTTNVSCHNEADGAINISVTGGDNNYTYSWSGPNGYSSTIQDISGLISGSYTVNVSDASGNSGTESFQIDQPTALTATTPTTTPVSCNGGSDGTITAGTPSGGNGGYSYSIDGITFQTTTNFNNLTAGNYTITIRDSKDCQITQNITVNEPTALTATTPTTTPVSCNG